MHPAIPILVVMFAAGVGYANPLLHLPTAVLGVPLALSYIAFSARSPQTALKRGWLAGSLASLAAMYWIAYPVGVYGGLPWALAVPCPVLIAMAIGMYFGIYSFIMHYAARTMPPLLLCLFSGLLWTSMETAQGTFFTGFPWMTMSSAFAFRPEWIQGASFIGAYGLSGLLTSVTTGILTWKISKSSKVWSISILTGLFMLGIVRATPQALSTLISTGNASIGIVQGNIDQASKWDSKYKKATFEKYLRLSEQLTDKADLVIWPETAMPFYIQDPGIMRAKLFNFATRTDTPILTGAPGYLLHGPKSFSLYNRAFLIQPGTTVMNWYDKVHLVPFGEYVPLKDYLPIGKLVQGAGDFIPGEDVQPLKSGNLAMGMLICYEGIFPELAQERVEKGANLLVNISNDAWYGNTSAPLQHLGLVALRAVEQGRYLIRDTNTGISACVDPLGRITNTTELFVDAAVLAKPELMAGETFYHANYKAVTRIPILLTLIFICWIIIKTRMNSSKLNKERKTD
ncbi:apolipoprotein N-acyltransferase [Maridesulfovibrio hydrothermalis]|uniref:Apolipoprotein N-acyltransferase n=1 Tax=Maridesulfovibrio hydrothermalis AM13 = DSM 14728 TaxID=1121451 RepID=L0RBW1_9BACT|nr:apolipoprotein N-acyltransferase [Maridesulfovibrio hydrothermalis]CCO24273.1 Apolipoprotein N-acyltransferase [Maridesulfovibrio hydrothermalis AM13 = DSM 14728]